MRIQELSENIHIKSTDSVERYLLSIIENYFAYLDGNITDPDSKEYIIRECVNRMKQDLIIDNAGVTSVNGETGDVILTIEKLGGEPKIEEKKTAFNVDFGTFENTACVGNDERLSDARTPLKHTHETNEIVGLQLLLDSLSTSVGNVKDYEHEHKNYALLNKLTYSGTKSFIDLAALDNAQTLIAGNKQDLTNSLDALRQTVETSIATTETLLNSKTKDFQTFVTNIQQQITDINSAHTLQIETEIDALKTLVSEKLSNLVTVEGLKNFTADFENVYKKIGEHEIFTSLMCGSFRYFSYEELAIGEESVSMGDEFVITISFDDHTYFTIPHVHYNENIGEPLIYSVRYDSDGLYLTLEPIHGVSNLNLFFSFTVRIAILKQINH